MSASTTHGVVAEQRGAAVAAGEINVVEDFPDQVAGGITETSRGLNLPWVRTVISRYAGRVNDLLKSRGIAPADVEGDTLATIQGGIVAKVMANMHRRVHRFEAARSFDDEWDEMMRILESSPEQLGDTDAPAARIKSNVATSSTKTYGKNFQW